MLVLALGLPLSGIWLIYSNDKEYIIAMGITFGFVLYYIAFTYYLYNHMRVNEDDDEYRHKMNMKFYSAMISTILPLGIVYILFIAIMFLVGFLCLCASMGTHSKMIGKQYDLEYICGKDRMYIKKSGTRIRSQSGKTGLIPDSGTGLRPDSVPDSTGLGPD